MTRELGTSPLGQGTALVAMAALLGSCGAFEIRAPLGCDHVLAKSEYEHALTCHLADRNARRSAR